MTRRLLQFALCLLLAIPASAAISRDGSCSAASTGCTLSATNTGSLIIAFAYRSGSTAPPTCPSGWTCPGSGSGFAVSSWGNATSGGGTTGAYLAGCKVASSSSDTGSGTWTNASGVAAVSYSGTAASSTALCAILGTGATGNNWKKTSTTTTYEGFDTNTTLAASAGYKQVMGITDGSSWVAGFMGDSTAANTCSPASGISVVSSTGARVSDSNGGLASWADHTCSVTSSTWMSFAVEIKALPASGCTLGVANHGDSVDNGASGSATIAGTIYGTGDLVVIHGWCYSGGCGTVSATVGSQSAAQTTVTGTNNGGGQGVLFYILSTSVTGAQTITFNAATAHSDIQTSYYDFVVTPGCSVTHDVDSIAGSGSGTAMNAPSITPSGAGELLFAFGDVATHTSSVNSPWVCNPYTNFAGGDSGDCTHQTTVNAVGYVVSSASGATAMNFTQLNSDDWGAIITSFSIASGGTPHSAPISETGSTSDTLARVVHFARSDSETHAASDSLSRLRTSFGAMAETNTASDSLARQANFGRGPIETNAATDSVARLGTFGRGDTETSTASDALARGVNFSRGGAETNTATDSLNRQASFSRSDTETSTASDALARAGTFARGSTETSTASDALARLANFARGTTESNVANDLLSALKPTGNMYDAVLSEVVSFSDSLGRLTTYLRADTETYSVSDALTRVASFQRGETETNGVSDSLGRLRTAFGGMMESYRANDTLARLGTFRRSETELWTVSDFVIVLRHGTIVVLPRHVFALPGLTKTGVEPGRTKTGSVPGEKKTGTAPVH